MECQAVFWIPYVVTAFVAVHLVDVFMRNGFSGVLKALAKFIICLPGVDRLVRAFTKREVDGFMSNTFEKNTQKAADVVTIPQKGIAIDELRQELVALKAGDGTQVEDGRLFAYVYTTEGPRMELQKEAFSMFTNMTLSDANSEHAGIVNAYVEAFMHDNALNPMVFPSLRKFENEVVSMTANMLNGDSKVVGSITSGGTESILMAMKTHRDRARSLKPKITQPNVIAPASIHPAFEKAAHYFNMTMKHVPVNKQTLICDVAEYEKKIDSNTILLLASAPSYPQAILDPVEEISRVAERHNLPLHVDACFGGFMLPWVEKLGVKIPKWDFRLPGVTSISADLHKYGFATKGASAVCYRNSSIRKHQFFAFSGWSGGLFVSPTMAGTRPGGHLAGAWAALRAMGQDGFIDMARQLMDTANKMKDGINRIQGLQVLGKPLMSAFAFASNDKDVSIFGVADVMEKKGWKLEVQRNPDSVHCTILPGHIKSASQWLTDLKEAVDYIRAHGTDTKQGNSAIYGMLSVVPSDGIIDNFLVDLFDEIYKT
ncbi:uncharacterized protein LOC143447526 isoform X1 [Clavelina lepadiformis]|uniref:uncharacterized protein LOC143447526 isoform X1 n=1 Tax=Clavelina lepadiformis TaxID=159417 RepID=UPI0040429FC2